MIGLYKKLFFLHRLPKYKLIITHSTVNYYFILQITRGLF